MLRDVPMRLPHPERFRRVGKANHPYLGYLVLGAGVSPPCPGLLRIKKMNPTRRKQSLRGKWCPDMSASHLQEDIRLFREPRPARQRHPRKMSHGGHGSKRPRKWRAPSGRSPQGRAMGFQAGSSRLCGAPLRPCPWILREAPLQASGWAH